MKASHKFLWLLFVSVLLFSFTKPVYRANFSGTWSLNSGKSDLGQFGGRGVASQLVIYQNADGNVEITRITAVFNGDLTSTTEMLTNNGKEWEMFVFGGAAKRKSTLKWAADGNTFAVNYILAFDQSEFKGDQFEFKGNENWSLSADGKRLTVKNNASSPQGEFSIKAVYDKQ